MLITNSICSTFAYRLRKGFRASDRLTGDCYLVNIQTEIAETSA